MKLQSFYDRSKELGVYKPSETPEELAERLGIPVSDVLKLDANENLFLPRKLMREVMKEASEETDPRLYPARESEELRVALSGYLGVAPDQIVLGGGSDQLIELLLHSMLRTGDEILAITPTFSVYGLTAKAMGIAFRTADLREDFSFDAEETFSAVTHRTKILVICNPNNPTGNQFEREKLLLLADGFRGLLVVDEAYVEYGGYSLVREATELDNLVILRTFSKAFGLAGMRLGYTVSNSDLARVLNERHQMPFPVSSTSIRAGLAILKRIDAVIASVEAAKTERRWLMGKLDSLGGVIAYPSQSNFVLFSTERNFEEIYDKLLNRGIITRKIGPVPGVPLGCLRVTLAPRDRLERFLENLEEALG